jgi:hypothetical protein
MSKAGIAVSKFGLPGLPEILRDLISFITDANLARLDSYL